jgi:hypothetical protein
MRDVTETTPESDPPEVGEMGVWGTPSEHVIVSAGTPLPCRGVKGVRGESLRGSQAGAEPKGAPRLSIAAEV